MNTAWFPVINASLNATSAVLLCVGLVLIHRNRWYAHAVCMVAAFVVSALFLISYLTYHTIKAMNHQGVTAFPEGSIKPLYLAILISHTILAVVVLPMILTTFYRAWKRQWDRHRKIARPTFWVWLYVSVTGVVVYWMLYHLAPTLATH